MSIFKTVDKRENTCSATTSWWWLEQNYSSTVRSPKQ